MSLVATVCQVVAMVVTPGSGHGGHIVEHMALRLLHCAEIGSHLFWLHDHFSQEHDPRAHDLADHAHHADNGVDLGQVPAIGPQLLPDIGHCVDADDVHALVGQVEEIVHHLIEYPGVAVVQIPLVGVKRRHHIVSHLRQIGKITRRCGGKYLGHRLLILPWDSRVGVEEIPAHVLSVSLAGSPGPLVILGGVVHDKIHAQADFLLMAFLRQL